VVPFILETWHFLQKSLRFLAHYFFVNASKTVFSEVSIESLVKKSVNKITILKFIGFIFAHGVRWVIFL